MLCVGKGGVVTDPVVVLLRGVNVGGRNRLPMADLRVALGAAGFTDVSISPTHEVADQMHSAIVKAVKPST